MENKYTFTQILDRTENTGDYKAIDLSTDENVIVRRFFCSDRNTSLSYCSEQFQKIAHHIQGFSHPHVLKITEADVDEDGPYTVTPIHEEQEVLIAFPEGLTLQLFKEAAIQILDGLSAIHAKGILHNGVQPDSVTLTQKNGKNHYMITDLGMHFIKATLRGENSDYREGIFIAPEVYLGCQPNEQSDLYMFGHLLYCFAAGGHPFGGMSYEEAAPLHTTHEFPPIHRLQECITKEWSEWLEKLIAVDPFNRFQSPDEAIGEMPVRSSITAVEPAAETAQAERSLSLPSCLTRYPEIPAPSEEVRKAS